jgi:hypothetical protein
MTFSVTVVDSDKRPDLYAELEYDGELVAEAFVEGERMRVAFVDVHGDPLWVAEPEQVKQALEQAREQLLKFGLLS